MTDDKNEVMEIFIGESGEQIAIIEAALLELEKEGTGRLDQNLVNELFRMAHSIKGGAGFFAFSKIRALTHSMENLFGAVRDKGLLLSPAAINTLLRCVDALRKFLEAPSVESEPDIEVLQAELAAALESGAAATPQNEDRVVVAPSESTSHPEETTALRASESSIRVNLQTLDRLMTLAGELVLTRNQLLQCISVKDVQMIEGAAQGINLITSEMQDAVMSTRMQSIGTAFSKFHRVVRDLSVTLGKRVRLVLEGEDVELDRTIIEAINAPMTHLVRNAIDHGLESPAGLIQDACGILNLD